MLKSIYNQSITVLNKLHRADNSSENVDKWFKHTITNGAWYPTVERSMNGSTVEISEFIKVMIPFNDEYRDYSEWKETTSSVTDLFTLSVGDYLVLGDVSEDVDNSNIVKTMTNYGKNKCQVKFIRKLYDRHGAFVQLYIEGV